MHYIRHTHSHSGHSVTRPDPLPLLTNTHAHPHLAHAFRHSQTHPAPETWRCSGSCNQRRCRPLLGRSGECRQGLAADLSLTLSLHPCGYQPGPSCPLVPCQVGLCVISEPSLPTLAFAQAWTSGCSNQGCGESSLTSITAPGQVSGSLSQAFYGTCLYSLEGLE